MKTSQGTTQEKNPSVWCYCISDKCLAGLNSRPRHPQTDPLTSQGKKTAHNKQIEPLQMMGLMEKVAHISKVHTTHIGGTHEIPGLENRGHCTEEQYRASS